MLPKEKNKMNLNILQMLRSRGMPDATPFPGEQGFQSTDQDLDQMGNVLIAGGQPIPPKKLDKLPMPPKQGTEEKKKKKRRPDEEEDPTEFLQADEAVEISGVN